MLTIGRMARIFGVTPKTLRLYESSGLFCPSHIDRWNGYRYYSPAQIQQLGRILRLHSIGLGVDEIARICSGNHSREQVRHGLEAYAERLEQSIAGHQAALRATRELIASLDLARDTQLHGEVLTLPPFRVIGLEIDEPQFGEIGSLWGRVRERAREIPSSEPGILCGVFYGHPESELRYLVGVPAAEDTPVPAGMNEWQIPSQRYAMFVHRGPVDALGNTMREIHELALPAQGLEPADGFDFERYDAKRGADLFATDAEVELYIPIR